MKENNNDFEGYSLIVYVVAVFVIVYSTARFLMAFVPTFIRWAFQYLSK